MGIYQQNGVCLGRNYKNSNYFHNFGNMDSIIEEKEWKQGFVEYNEVIRVLKQSLEHIKSTKDKINNGTNEEAKERSNKLYQELFELIERIQLNLSEDNWYFFELCISSYEGLNVDRVEYLPINRP